MSGQRALDERVRSAPRYRSGSNSRASACASSTCGHAPAPARESRANGACSAARAPTGARNERMCGVAADRRRERHLHGLGEDQSLRDLEVRAHPVRVDVEPLDHFDHRGERAGRASSAISGSVVPFGRPVAEPALVLLHGGRQHRRHESGHANRRRERDRRADRIALLRHRRRAAAARQRRLERFADFGLREQRRRRARACRASRSACRASPRRRRTGRAACATACRAHRAPGSRRAPRSPRCRDRRATPASRQRRRTARPAPARRAATPGAADGDRARSSTPASLTPSVTGNACCSHVRPASTVARVAARLRRERSCEPVDVRFDQRERVAHLQHECRVDDVLARRTPVHVASGAGAAAATLRVNAETSGMARFPACARRGAIAATSNPSGVAFARDRSAAVARDDADARLRLRQRRFEVSMRAMRARSENTSRIASVANRESGTGDRQCVWTGPATVSSCVTDCAR